MRSKISCFAAALAASLGALAQPASAQNCMSMPGMTMCDDGRMMFGGVWMSPPPIPGLTMRTQVGPGEIATWSMREVVNPDGTRTQRWERKTRAPDGAERVEEQTRLVFPDGRVCLQDGPTLRCP
jgi:hypothetical protein